MRINVTLTFQGMKLDAPFNLSSNRLQPSPNQNFNEYKLMEFRSAEKFVTKPLSDLLQSVSSDTMLNFLEPQSRQLIPSKSLLK